MKIQRIIIALAISLFLVAVPVQPINNSAYADSKLTSGTIDQEDDSIYLLKKITSSNETVNFSYNKDNLISSCKSKARSEKIYYKNGKITKLIANSKTYKSTNKVYYKNNKISLVKTRNKSHMKNLIVLDLDLKPKFKNNKLKQIIGYSKGSNGKYNIKQTKSNYSHKSGRLAKEVMYTIYNRKKAKQSDSTFYYDKYGYLNKIKINSSVATSRNEVENGILKKREWNNGVVMEFEYLKVKKPTKYYDTILNQQEKAVNNMIGSRIDCFIDYI